MNYWVRKLHLLQKGANEKCKIFFIFRGVTIPFSWEEYKIKNWNVYCIIPFLKGVDDAKNDIQSFFNKFCFS